MAKKIEVIPCLDMSEGRVVKGVKFEELRDAGDAVHLAKEYYRSNEGFQDSRLFGITRREYAKC